MNRHLLALTLIPALLFSCTACTEKREQVFRDYAVAGKLHDTEIFATWPSIRFSMDSLLIVYANRSLGKSIKVYSRETMKEIASHGTVGRGPGEFFALELNSKHGNRFFGRNMNFNELVVFEVAADAGKVGVKEVERMKYERIMYDDMAHEDSTISYLDEGHFVGVSFGGSGKFFSLYDDRMNWLAHFGDAPVPEEVRHGDSRMYLNGKMATNDGAFVFSPLRLPKIAYYSVGKGSEIPQKQWEDTFYDSFYRVTNGLIGFDDNRTVGQVLDLALGDEYVYVLFLDVPLGDYSVERTETYTTNIVLVYDRRGNRIARLNLDRRIYGFCVTDDEKTLYGMAPIPEDRIVEYPLPKF